MYVALVQILSEYALNYLQAHIFCFEMDPYFDFQYRIWFFECIVLNLTSSGPQISYAMVFRRHVGGERFWLYLVSLEKWRVPPISDSSYPDWDIRDGLRVRNAVWGNGNSCGISRYTA